jgi:hypothetical protein
MEDPCEVGLLLLVLLLFVDLCRPETKTTAARVPASLSPKFCPCPFIEKKYFL